MNEATGSDDYKARRLRHRYAKLSSDEQDYVSEQHLDKLCLFEDIEQPIQDLLRAATEIDAPEIRVLVHFQDQDNWLLMTSRRVVWKSAGDQRQLEFRQITYYGLTQAELIAEANNPSVFVAGIDGTSRENRQPVVRHPIEVDHWISLAGTDGVRHRIQLDKLDKYLVLEELLPFMIRLEEIHRRD